MSASTKSVLGSFLLAGERRREDEWWVVPHAGSATSSANKHLTSAALSETSLQSSREPLERAPGR